jgi:hypothetical protein
MYESISTHLEMNTKSANMHKKNVAIDRLTDAIIIITAAIIIVSKEEKVAGCTVCYPYYCFIFWGKNQDL